MGMLTFIVRGWANYDEKARNAVEKCDAIIVERLSELLTEVDARHPDFPGLVHAAITTPGPGRKSAVTLVDLIIALK